MEGGIEAPSNHCPIAIDDFELVIIILLYDRTLHSPLVFVTLPYRVSATECSDSLYTFILFESRKQRSIDDRLSIDEP